jgi:hypothetical protein
LKKTPSSIKADPELVRFLSSLEEKSYLLKILNKGLDKLEENMFTGDQIERKKFPKYYVQKYQINNLYKLNLNSRYRLTYTLIGEKSGIAVVVLEVLDHKEYEKRFGYS